MPIRAFLYSRRAEGASEQAQWPSAILLIDNDPDKDTLPISQTSNKVKHSLSSFNNIHTAARVMDRPPASECEEGETKLPADRKWWKASCLSIWDRALPDGKQRQPHFSASSHKRTKSSGVVGVKGGRRAKHFSNDQSFWWARLLDSGCCTHAHTCGMFVQIGEVNSLLFS